MIDFAKRRMSAREWMRNRRIKNRAEGICISCGTRPMTQGHKTCDPCRQTMRAYNKLYYASAKGQAARARRPGAPA